MSATFQNTVDILVKAYLNDTLKHQNCHACAVGNIVACNMGFEYVKAVDGDLIWKNQPYHASWAKNTGWSNVFSTCVMGRSVSKFFTKEEYTGVAKEQIDSTGYSLEDLMKIEYAFETAEFGGGLDEYMFNGLMKVLDVLADIHGISLESKESAKALFVKA
ncbi:MAG TPA: hypothetical protein VGK59_18660 [Ohtaekwangia sp.]